MRGVLCLKWMGLMLLAAPLLQGCASPRSAIQAGRSCSPAGQYGSSLTVLQAFYTAPKAPGESNYFIDTQGGESLRSFALAHGLTNNHALFVVSHGTAVPTPSGARYAFYPATGKDYGGDMTGPRFSIQDIAAIIGPANARNVHNLVLASCNRENALRPEEIRACFPNVTNLTHAAPETDAQWSTFRHALTYHSRDIQFLYAMPDTFTVGVFDGDKKGRQKSRKLVPYVAELYLPGGATPYLTQTAGRELLQPSKP